MLEIYAIAGGDWLRGNLNAIAAFMGTSTWSTIEKMCIAISVLIVAGNWVKKHNVMDLIGWVFSLTLVSMLVVIRTPVQIIDYSNVAQVYEVDNVPIGLAIPASLTTRVGNALIQSYEMVFALPDSVTYSKTGMLFGSNLVAKSTDFLSQNPQITTLFSDYVQNCVMGDIFLNHKYSFEELLNSPDPYTLIFANPSPLRGVFDKNNQFQTCEEASRDLKSALALDTQTGGKTWNYYVRQLFGGKPNPDLLFSQMIGDSYNYFYSSGQSAGQIIRQNVTMNALRSGIQSYAARSGDTASLVNMANTSSLEKQRLAQATMGHQALRTLPLMQTVIMGIMIGMFPIMVMAAMFNMMTLQVLKGYVFALIWLQTWPLLFAILNSAMAYYAKQNGVPVVLSELSQVQLKNSDIATTAGYIAVMIPPLSWGDREEHGSSLLQCLQPFFFIGSQCNIAGCLRRGGRQLLVCQHADGERQRLQLGYQQHNQFRTDVAAAGEWRHEHADAGWLDGLGQWWCNVKTAGGYQRRSSDSQCAATDGP